MAAAVACDGIAGGGGSFVFAVVIVVSALIPMARAQLITKFKPSPEEELMSATNMILLKCCQLPPATLLNEPPEAMTDMLLRCYKKFFADGAATSRSPRAAGSPASVTDAKKGAFERDLLAIVPGGARNPNVSGDMTTVSPWQDCCVS